MFNCTFATAIVTARYCLAACMCNFVTLFNPLELRANYSATLNNMKLVHSWSLMGGLLHLVQQGVDRAGLQPTQAFLRCTAGWAVTFGTARSGQGRAAAHPGLSSLYQM